MIGHWSTLYADSKPCVGLNPEQWDNEFFAEYLKQNRYKGRVRKPEVPSVRDMRKHLEGRT